MKKTIYAGLAHIILTAPVLRILIEYRFCASHCFIYIFLLQ